MVRVAAMANDLQTASRANLASGNTAGSLGFFRLNSVTLYPPLGKTHLRSHLGHNAGVPLACAPTNPECTVPPLLFRVLLLERLQLPLPILEATCEGCGDPVDPLGRQAVSRSGPPPIERMVRIFLEAGAQNACLHDMNIGVSSMDERRVEVLAQDLPCFGVHNSLWDVTLVSVLCSSGEPQPHAAEVDGVALERTQHVKEATHPELAASERCRLVVLTIETGGQWSEEAARDVPQHMTQQVSWAWERRWTRVLATGSTVGLLRPRCFSLGCLRLEAKHRCQGCSTECTD